MAQPTPFARDFSFTDFSALNPSGQQPGTSLDAEFDAVELTLAEVLANLSLIQRDDGQLHNEIVTLDSLSAEVLALITGGEVTLTVTMSNIVGLTAALALLAPLASPALTGVPTAPNAALGTNTTQIANTAFVQAAIAALINSSPGALDTLNELATALGNDANFAATMTAALAGKQAASANLTTYAGIAPAANVQSVLGAANYAAIRTLLGLVIGTDVQAFDQQLADVAALSYSGNALKVLRVNAAANGFELASAATGAPYRKVFRPTENEAPATNFATLDTRNGHPLLNSSDVATGEQQFYSDVLSAAYAGAGLTVTLWLAAATATSGDAKFEVAFERMASQDLDIDSFAAAKSGVVTMSGTSGIMVSLAIAFSNSEIDSLAAGEPYRIVVRCLSADAAHTLTTDVQTVFVVVAE